MRSASDRVLLDLEPYAKHEGMARMPPRKLEMGEPLRVEAQMDAV